MKRLQNNKWIVIILSIFIFTIGVSIKNMGKEPIDNLPGEIIADDVKEYALNPENNTIYYFTLVKNKDSYYETVFLHMFDGNSDTLLDEIIIGGGLVNAEPEIFFSKDSMALFIENVVLPGSSNTVSGLCRQYEFSDSRARKIDTTINEFNPDSNKCKEIFAKSNTLLKEGPYSDTSYMSQIENFYEFDGSIKYEQYKCPGIDTCDYKTTVKIGQNYFTHYGSYSLSLNGYQVDNEGNLIIVVNSKLYKIPTNTNQAY